MVDVMVNYFLPSDTGMMMAIGPGMEQAKTITGTKDECCTESNGSSSSPLIGACEVVVSPVEPSTYSFSAMAGCMRTPNIKIEYALQDRMTIVGSPRFDNEPPVGAGNDECCNAFVTTGNRDFLEACEKTEIDTQGDYKYMDN